MLRKLLAAACFALCMASPAISQQAVQTNNKSVTIATGNTFQAILPFDQSRRSLTIENNNSTDSCWIAFGRTSSGAITAGNATKGISQLLLPGGSLTRYYPFIPVDEIEGTCASSSDTIYIDVQ